MVRFGKRLVLGTFWQAIPSMTKDERLKFMRKQFGRPRGLFAAEPRPQEGPKASYHFDAFGVPQRLRELRQKRIYTADPKPALRLAYRRNGRISPLTKIAQKWRLSPLPRSSPTGQKRPSVYVE
jgi:hypothetical protein